MNQRNLDYLKENLKYIGFGENLYPELEKNIQQSFPEFVLKLGTEINRKAFEATLHFRKSDNTDMYFFNSWEGKIKTDVGTERQTFYLNKGQGITMKEGFNMLDGRAVHTDLTNKEGQRYQAWVQLDFGERDTNGNYRMKQYHSNYGYDLEKTLLKYPIKELQDSAQKEMLIRSLQKGNVQAATMESRSSVQKVFLSANPQFKSLSIYDANGLRLSPKSLLEQLGKENRVGEDHQLKNTRQNEVATEAPSPTNKKSVKQVNDNTVLTGKKKQRQSKRKGQSV